MRVNFTCCVLVPLLTGACLTPDAARDARGRTISPAALHSSDAFLMSLLSALLAVLRAARCGILV